MAKPRLNEVNADNLKWINITHPTELETVQLKSMFGFSDLDLKAVLPPIQRPRIDMRDGHIFMILLYPKYDRATRKIHAVEVDFFIGKDYLITTSSEELDTLTQYFVEIKKSKKLLASMSVESLLYEILNKLEKHLLPMSVHLSTEIDQIENEVFSATDKQKTINDVLLLKTNIVNFRKAFNRHTKTLQHLTTKMPQLFPNFSGEPFKGLIEETDDLWDVLENYQDTMDAIHDSHLSLLNYRSNSIMQIFTVFTTMIFMLELVISLISLTMETSLSAYGNWMTFSLISTGLLLVCIIMLLYFKRKNWI